MEQLGHELVFILEARAAGFTYCPCCVAALAPVGTLRFRGAG